MTIKSFTMRKIILFGSGFLCFSLSPQIFASAFQLWEQNAVSIGNYHAGYAAEANDASIAFYNPAGITLIQNQQVVVSGFAAVTNFKFKGTVAVNNILNNTPQAATAQGGGASFVPNLEYVAPITDRIGFGFTVTVPFGLQTNYGYDSVVRYASTLVSIKVIDISPSLGLQLTDKSSIGFGPDLQYANAEFDQVAGLGGTPRFDTNSINQANDTGWGYHAGWLYQFTPETRLGLSYHSQVVHHLSRKSKFEGPIAGDLNPIVSRATANITLPPYTAVSLYHRINPKITVMSTVIYTQWNVLRELLMKNIAAVDEIGNPTTLTVDIPEYFKNTWNVSVGANYDINDQVTLTSGVGYDETPVQNAYRTVQLPDNDRFVIAFGGHYQYSKAMGFDLGWSHFFMRKAKVAPPVQVTGNQQVTTNGSVTGGADVYGAQLTWNFV